MIITALFFLSFLNASFLLSFLSRGRICVSFLGNKNSNVYCSWWSHNNFFLSLLSFRVLEKRRFSHLSQAAINKFLVSRDRHQSECLRGWDEILPSIWGPIPRICFMAISSGIFIVIRKLFMKHCRVFRKMRENNPTWYMIHFFPA